MCHVYIYIWNDILNIDDSKTKILLNSEKMLKNILLSSNIQPKTLYITSLLFKLIFVFNKWQIYMYQGTIFKWILLNIIKCLICILCLVSYTNFLGSEGSPVENLKRVWPNQPFTFSDPRLPLSPDSAPIWWLLSWVILPSPFHNCIFFPEHCTIFYFIP